MVMLLEPHKAPEQTWVSKFHGQPMLPPGPPKVVSMATKTPFPWQQAIIDDDLQAYGEGRRYAMCTIPTGTGKTCIAVAEGGEIAKQQEAATGKRCVAWVITMASLKEQWLNEILAFDHRDINPARGDIIFVGDQSDTQQDREMQILLAAGLKPRWVIMNYDQLRLHADTFIKCVDPDNDIVILDEADNIQNSSSDRSLVARAVQCHWRGVFTATPVKNMVDSLYALLQFCDPGPRRRHEWSTKINGEYKYTTLRLPYGSPEWGTQSDFEYEYCQKDSWGHIVGTMNLPDLHRRLQRFGMHIVEKREVLDIPELHTQVEYIKLSPEGQKVYDLAKFGAVKALDELEWRHGRYFDSGNYQVAQCILAILTMMRRATTMSPYHFSEHANRLMMEKNGLTGIGFEMPKLPPELLTKDNAKLDWTKDYINEHFPTGKEPGGMLVYSEWTDVLDEVRQGLNGIGERMGLGLYRGGVSMRSREETRLGVLNGQKKLVLTSDAGGRGLNLQALNRAVIMNLPWTPTQVEQLAGRIERMGQENEMFVHYLVVKGTVDERKMLPTILNKKKDSDMILHGKRGRKTKGILDGLNRISDVQDWI